MVNHIFKLKGFENVDNEIAEKINKVKEAIDNLEKYSIDVGDLDIECSRGLHVGSVKYLENNNYVSDSDTILLVLVNPQHVIAVPKYDNSKLRVCEYFPISI